MVLGLARVVGEDAPPQPPAQLRLEDGETKRPAVAMEANGLRRPDNKPIKDPCGAACGVGADGLLDGC